jgi:hypothetical protein
MSTAPTRSTVAATHAAAASGSPALASNTSSSPARPPSSAARISLAVVSSASRLRDDSITFAPLAARPSAMARPMPRDAPVTSAALPSSLISIAPS